VKQNNEKGLLVDVAVMYYLEGKTQSEIAKTLFMSRPTVSRLLQRARDLDVVDIKINYDNDEFDRLKNIIYKHFKIKNLLIVKSLKSETDTIKEMGKAAASELKYHLQDNLTIGMSWGRSVKKMVDAFKEKPLSNIRVVELFGAVDYSENAEMLSIGYDFSRKVKGHFYPLPAPVFIHDLEIKNQLIKNPIISNTLKMLDNCDLIITGLGVVNSKLPQKIWDVYTEPSAQNDILNAGGVGFICARFFNQEGQFISHKINEHVIGIQIEKIDTTKLFVIAGGLTKARAIYAMLKRGSIHTLVTDDQTIKKIIQMDQTLKDLNR
jgi:deoxyribonucleoside regulator